MLFLFIYKNDHWKEFLSKFNINYEGSKINKTV